MYRVSYTVEAAAARSPELLRTRWTEYFATESAAMARLRQLLDDGRCIAVCSGNRSARSTAPRLKTRLGAARIGKCRIGPPRPPQPLIEALLPVPES
jgi:hypothetical protein